MMTKVSYLKKKVKKIVKGEIRYVVIKCVEATLTNKAFQNHKIVNFPYFTTTFMSHTKGSLLIN